MLVDPAGSELDVSLELAAGAADDTTTTLLPGRNGLMYSQKIASALFVCNRQDTKYLSKFLMMTILTCIVNPTSTIKQNMENFMMI